MKKKNIRFLTAGGLLGYNLICGYLIFNYPVKSIAWVDNLIKCLFVGIFLIINYYYVMWYEKTGEEEMK